MYGVTYKHANISLHLTVFRIILHKVSGKKNIELFNQYQMQTAFVNLTLECNSVVAIFVIKDI